MTNSKTLLTDTLRQLERPVDNGEKRETVLRLLEQLAGLSRAEIIAGRDIVLSPAASASIESAITRLNRNEPLQYVFGEADFYGRTFFVNKCVLIPRPETELIIDEALQYAGEKMNLRILDIGTGSGCLAITLAKELPTAIITATDLKTDALDVARQNADRHTVSISFLQHNILTDPLEDRFDIIVTNPPYIPEGEKNSLDRNVSEYEPHTALFVPDTDPLIFYRVIAEKAPIAMNPGGILIAEINEQFGEEVSELFNEAGFHTKIIRDLDAKDRVIASLLS